MPGDRRPAWRRRNIPGKGGKGICNFVDWLCYISVTQPLLLSVSNPRSYLLTVPVTRLAERACRALKGEKGLRECSYVYLPGIEGGKEIAETIGLDFFSVPVELGVSEAKTPLSLANANAQDSPMEPAESSIH